MAIVGSGRDIALNVLKGLVIIYKFGGGNWYHNEKII